MDDTLIEKNISMITGRVRRLTKSEKRMYPNYKYVVIDEHELNIHGKLVRVPSGFLTDGSSGGPDFGRSWLFHDWLYSTHEFEDGDECTRAEADEIMNDILKNEKMYMYCWFFVKFSKMNIFKLFSKAYRKSGERGPEYLISEI